MRRLGMVVTIALASSSLHCSSDSPVTCGAGTHLEDRTCVADVDAEVDSGGGKDASNDARDANPANDASDADARDVVTDAAPSETSADTSVDAPWETTTDAPVDAADALACAKACDCPSGTICAIDGTCTGSACTDRCSSSGDCTCGHACVGGYCDFYAGSLVACSHDCDCAHGEVCGNGRCIVVCGRGGPDCAVDADCAACGEVCEPYSGRCTPKGEGCSCTGTCATWGLDGEICDTTSSNCVTPSGTLADFGGGAFGAMSPTGGRTFTATVSVSASGSTTKITVVSDLDVSTSDVLSATLTGPDGSPRSVGLSWSCAGAGPTRWVGVLDLSATPVPRTGSWSIVLDDMPMPSPPPATVTHLWVYLG